MAQVLPAERDLRRVIGDADGAGDRQVEGLGEQELLELYRSMVQLRTYDERSVVYHSQGRIGTYAIFWNHEAMQAGAAHALDDEDWIFPSYRESAIGLLRGMPPATVLHWWRGHPAGWWNPADYNVASICVPIATQVPHAAVEARRSSRRSRIAPRRTRPLTIPAPTSIPSGSSRRFETSASDATSATCGASASSATTSTRRSRMRPPQRCALGSPPRKPSRSRTSRCSSSTRTQTRRRPLQPISPSCAGSWETALA